MSRNLSARLPGSDDAHIRRMKAYGLRLGGASYHQIAQYFKVSAHTAKAYVTDAMKLIEADTAAEMVKLEHERLDAALRASTSILQLYNDECALAAVEGRPPVFDFKLVLAAAHEMVWIGAERRKFAGLDAAQKIDLGGIESTDEDKLMDLIRAQNRKNNTTNLDDEANF